MRAGYPTAAAPRVPPLPERDHSGAPPPRPSRGASGARPRCRHRGVPGERDWRGGGGGPSGRRVAQHGTHAFNQLVELPFGVREAFPAGGGQPVVLRAAAGFGEVPLGGDPLALFHAVQGRVERAFLDLQHLVAGALDVLGDAIPVEGFAVEQGLQYQKIQAALQIVLGHSYLAPVPSPFRERGTIRYPPAPLYV